jgi:hypothetical protein
MGIKARPMSYGYAVLPISFLSGASKTLKGLQISIKN